MINLEKLLIKLLKIKSEKGNEKEIGNYVFKFLKKEGFKVKKIPVDRNGFDIIAELGTPKVYFSTHLDTVKGFLPVKETKLRIYGRGACDAKGSLAAMICAAIKSKKQGLSNFGLIFTVREEGNFRGIKKLLKSKIKIPFVIVGEPTSLEIANAHFGILVLEIIAKGKSSHSSEPKKGINAINKLLKAIELVKKMKMGKKSFFSICKIKGGIADNIIPDKAKATITFRISPNDKTDYFKKVRKQLKNLANVKKKLELSGVITKVPKELSFIKKVKTVKYFTELSYYKKGVVFGPGDIKFAHSDKEMIEKSDLRKAVKIYKRIIENYNL
jgi:acetylornithine deacetylase